MALSGVDPGLSVALYVADNGPGIAPEESQKVWERGYRGLAAKQLLKKSSTRATDGEESLSRNRGAGLGLYLARQMIEAMKGCIVLQSPWPVRQPERVTTTLNDVAYQLAHPNLSVLHGMHALARAARRGRGRPRKQGLPSSGPGTLIGIAFPRALSS